MSTLPTNLIFGAFRFPSHFQNPKMTVKIAKSGIWTDCSRQMEPFFTSNLTPNVEKLTDIFDQSDAIYATRQDPV